MKNLLIVDDDPDLSEFLKEELARIGYQVTAVRCGNDAVIATQQQHFDLLILDMLMSGMDGIQVIKSVRLLKPGLPILGLTGYLGRGYLTQAERLGVKCLAKPVIISDLVDEIQSLLTNNAP